MDTKKIKLAIADDHPLFLKGLEGCIKYINDIDLIIAAKNGKELIEMIKSQKPDVILMDLRMPVMDGKEATIYIKKEYPDIKIIVLSMYEGEFTIAQLMRTGANGFLRKNADIDEIQTAIYTVIRDEFYYDKNVTEAMHKDVTNKLKIGFDFLTGFKMNELKTLKFICDGFTSAEIAEKLNVSSRTVDDYRNNLLDKLDVKNTASLIKCAIVNNLVDIDLRTKNI